MKTIETRTEKIVCPNCGAIEVATVTETGFFNMYHHVCSQCEYIIIESEWESSED